MERGRRRREVIFIILARELISIGLENWRRMRKFLII